MAWQNNNQSFGQFGQLVKDNDPNPHTLQALQLNETISIDGLGPVFTNDDFTILPEGDYNFIVKKAGFEDYAGGQKIPPCAKLAVSLELTAPDGSRGRSMVNFFLLKDPEYIRRLAAFYTSIGVIAPDAKTFGLTADIVGRNGRGHFYPYEYKGKKYNRMSKAVPLDPNDPPAGVKLGNNTSVPF